MVVRKVNFSIPVECALPYSNNIKIYNDDGIILFPDSYSNDGAATRLVISCHGAGGTVTTNDSQIESQTLTKYLLANGYAVMDVNGLPYEFADEFGIDIRNNVGSPIAIQSYIKAYWYCIENFNLHKEVCVYGGSMGGISSTNLVLSGKIPVLVQTGFCPVLDTYNEIFLHPWSNGLPKTALSVIFSFEKDNDDEYIYDEVKVLGYNPINSKKDHPCPLLFCHSINDPIVDFETTKQYIVQAKRQGIEAELIALPDGKHEPQDYGMYIDKPIGNRYYNDGLLNITVAIESVFSWISKYASPSI